MRIKKVKTIRYHYRTIEYQYRFFIPLMISVQDYASLG